MSRSDDTPPPFDPAIGGPPFDDPDAPPSEEELAAAEGLRRALEASDRGTASRKLAEFAESAELAKLAELAELARAAVTPSELDPARQKRILEAALPPARSNVRYVTFGVVASVAAIAASVALMLAQERDSTLPTHLAAARPAAVSRSAASLFPEGIPLTGGTSQRVDRIAYARAQDLRENRFARWGAR